MFSIHIDKKSQKYLDKLAKDFQRRILTKICALETFPNPGLDIKKLEGEENAYRLRVGKWRVLFIVDEKESEILVYDIDVRGQIYK